MSTSGTSAVTAGNTEIRNACFFHYLGKNGGIMAITVSLDDGQYSDAIAQIISDGFYVVNGSTAGYFNPASLWLH